MKALKRIAIGLAFLFAAGVTVIAVDGLDDDATKSDVAVVLGSKVMPDGTPSARLRARLDRTADLYQQGLVLHVIVSGGTGKEGFSEARVMADYLIDQRKLPRTAIILDEMGNTTQATAQNSAAIMRQRGFTRAIVVTQYFHVTRSRYALHQAGVVTVHSAHARYLEWRDLYSVAREVIALPTYWIASGSQ
ncbi:YdcF family protein [Niveibacterium sp. 24ML]|uniref:YdcF family protein n=1 Tax=Niveibacterium sp. 24ML TaxID=2985512 RepID=UPI002270123D|nr:YdcF family protein [Niveibacterium sp. 24ML]MCX9156517.1 YdcF family protein [Niveibacterium sp. 24ML]